jgi:hypothetical protein
MGASRAKAIGAVHRSNTQEIGKSRFLKTFETSRGKKEGIDMDIYDGAPWTEMDIEDLRSAIEHCHSIKEIAEFLCRADSVDDVARKCEELGLQPQLKAKGK